MSEPRLKLISADKGQALTVLLGPLDDAELPETGVEDCVVVLYGDG
ncbi:hypothetical protein [Streptomyces sp. ADI95-16]|nr:hypothetical protein [Streptomyces sp. ADI95-16]